MKEIHHSWWWDKLFVGCLCFQPPMSRQAAATFLIISDCVSFICVLFYITFMSCHTCQINGVCRFGEIMAPSCGVRFVLIRMPLLSHMYPCILRGRVRFCEVGKGKGIDSDAGDFHCFLSVKYVSYPSSSPRVEFLSNILMKWLHWNKAFPH